MTERERLLEQARSWACWLEAENARLIERVAFLETFIEPTVEEWDE